MTVKTFTMTRGVLQAFRRRLPLADSLRFARTLPVGLRALYVADWDPDEPLSPVGTRDGWTREAQGLRAEHNFAPPSAVADVAAAVRRHLVDPAAFEAVLAELPPWTREFWSAEPEISSPSGRTRTPAPGR